MKLKYFLVLLFSVFCFQIFAFNFRDVVSSTNRISTVNEFENLAGVPLESTFSRVKSVKLVYNIKQQKIYYLNSNKYRLHYDFCESVLKYPFGLEVFNEENYSNHNNRTYVLATLNYFQDSKQFGLEFFSDNVITSTQLLKLYDEISKSTFIGTTLKVFLNNENIINLFKSEKINLPTLPIDEIYSKQTYQSIKNGTTYGILRIFDDSKNVKSNSNDILVINGTPLEIPLCKAVVTNTFQTPLSHIQVITQNRNIPSCAVKNIFKDSKIISLNNKAVRIQITNDSLVIEKLDSTQIKKYLNSNSILPRLKKLTFDISKKDILALKDIRSSHAKSIGSKAFELSELYDLSLKYNDYFKTPEMGFCIPFYYYSKHILNNNIRIEIEKLFQMHDDDSLIKYQLGVIRNSIIETPIDSTFLNEVWELINKNSEFKTFRFRSSSNAEDLYEFCGAGLYDSYTGNITKGKLDIELAIKKVWASVFNFRAFQERTLYNIDEETVMMGVLVHRSFPNEKSNGVVITKNIYRNDYPGFVVNVQFGDISVVRPPENVVCEQLICNAASLIHNSEKELSIKYICKSNLIEGNVLDQAELEKLYISVDYISQYFLRKTSYVDIEFKFAQDGQLYIKQVRPYKVNN